MSVYFIQSGDAGPIKIGYTSNVSSRLKALQTGQAEELRLLAQMAGTLSQERKLHRMFAEHRLNGEWFAPHPDILKHIASLGVTDPKKPVPRPIEPYELAGCTGRFATFAISVMENEPDSEDGKAMQRIFTRFIDQDQIIQDLVASRKKELT